MPHAVHQLAQVGTLIRCELITGVAQVMKVNRRGHAIAVMAGESETYLWPRALPSQRRTEVARSEIVQVYPHRSSVPADLWDHLLEKAATYIDVLVYVGMFMTEMPDLPKTLREKA
jgi:hypothetical protein